MFSKKYFLCFPQKHEYRCFLVIQGILYFIIESMDTPRETKDFFAWIMLVDWETFFWTLSFDVLWVSSFCSQFGSPWPVSCSVLVREQTATLNCSCLVLYTSGLDKLSVAKRRFDRIQDVSPPFSTYCPSTVSLTADWPFWLTKKGGWTTVDFRI